MTLFDFSAPVTFLDKSTSGTFWREFLLSFHAHHAPHLNHTKFSFGGDLKKSKGKRNIIELLEDADFVDELDVFLHFVVLRHLGYEINPRLLAQDDTLLMTNLGLDSDMSAFRYTLPQRVYLQMEQMSAHTRLKIEQSLQIYRQAKLMKQKAST